MQNLNDGQQQLQLLARWGQMQKQLDRQLKQLTKALASSKAIVDRLAAKGIDLSSFYSQFESGIKKLQAVRDDAVQKVQDGNIQDAFDELDSDFFGQIQDVSQNQQTIKLMSNLGRFSSQFKSAMNQAKRTIASLKRNKIDTTDLEAMFADAQAKGDAVAVLLKTSPIDQDAIMNALQDMQTIKQELDSKLSELQGNQGAGFSGGDFGNFNTFSLPPEFKNAVQNNNSAANQL